MGKIIFLTSGKINYEFEGKTLYESIKLTASGKRFPNIEKGAEKEVIKVAMPLGKYKPAVIFAATSNQCLETAELIADSLSISLIKKRYLLPLRFDLDNFFSEKEFLKFGKNKFIKLRKLFIESFFENKLIDNNKEIIERFELLKHDLGICKSNSIIAVSHAYLIKLFSIYYQVGDRMYKDKELLFKLFNPEKEMMKRLETLILNL